MMRYFFGAAIFIFWAAMWTLLVRTEHAPEMASVRRVPIEHVLKLLFQHEQASDLSIRVNRDRLGNVRIQPRHDETSGALALEFNGTMQVQLPDTQRRRLSWNGAIDLAEALDVNGLSFTLMSRNPGDRNSQPIRVEFAVDAKTKTAEYGFREGEGMITRQRISLDRAGLELALANAGLDASVLPAATAPPLTTPEVKAHRARLMVKGERLETYLLTLTQEGQTLGEVHVSQMGQILRISTLLGWVFEPE